MENIKRRLKELYSRFADYREKRKRRDVLTQEDLEKLSQMLEDYKRREGIQ